jgi:hypothetical protein
MTPAKARLAAVRRIPRAQGMLGLCVAVLLLAAAGHAVSDGRNPGGPSRAATLRILIASPVPAPVQRAQPIPARPCPVVARGFSCAMQLHIRAVERYLAHRPGTIGVVLHDRITGATWRNANASVGFPAASTIKLAMVTDLLLRSQAGTIRLSDADWTLIHNALHQSSDEAADQLWFAFENGRFLRRIEHFGMDDASFSGSLPYWGYMYCTPEDLDRLINYVLGELPDGSRSYLVYELRHVARIQQWGVWGAGPADRPGNKDGWEDDNGTWIVDTVGFAGPDARYTLVIMDDLRGEAGFRVGTNTLTQAASLLFRGQTGTTPTAEATP